MALPTNLIPKTLLDSQWYIDQLGLLLKKSTTITEQLRMYVSLIQNINDKEMDLFNLLGTQDEGSNEWHLNLKQINDLDKTKSDLLDKIASILGLQRTYYFKGYHLPSPNPAQEGEPFENITLNNDQLYCLIYATIIKNNYDGTTESIENLYEKLQKFFFKVSGISFEIILVTNSLAPGECDVYFDSSYAYNNDDNSIKPEYKNIIALYENGFFDFKSMGIRYYHQIIKFSKTLVWNYLWVKNEGGEAEKDTNNDRVKWNEGYWS